jgi:argininosuccinate lyase
MKKTAKTPYKLWGGRFEQSASSNLDAFSQSIAFDYRLVQADILGTKVYARALQRAGMLSRSETARAARALDALARQAAAAGKEFFLGAAEEDIHTFVLGKLHRRIGALAEKLHTGRSRNEQVALDFRLWMKENIRLTQDTLRQLLTALIWTAEKNSFVILPGYTHLRRAQAVLWPHYALAYFEMFRRDFERLEAVYGSADVLPLGSGALAGSGLGINRARIAKELGFSRISRNSMDAVSDRDFALEYLFAAGICFLHMSRLAEDFILYSSEEFGFLELADEVSTGSSLMPQKKNPDSMELIRGKTGRILGNLVSLATTLKGLPLAYNRDLQEDKEPVFDVAAQWPPALQLAAQVVRTAILRPSPMQKAASDGWLCATDLAEFLSLRGVSFHKAHEIVGTLVLESLRAGKQPTDCSLEHLRRYSSLFDREAMKLLQPVAGLARRTVDGGTASSSVRRALREARSWLRSTA